MTNFGNLPTTDEAKCVANHQCGQRMAQCSQNSTYESSTTAVHTPYVQDVSNAAVR